MVRSRGHKGLDGFLRGRVCGGDIQRGSCARGVWLAGPARGLPTRPPASFDRLGGSTPPIEGSSPVSGSSIRRSPLPHQRVSRGLCRWCDVPGADALLAALEAGCGGGCQPSRRVDPAPFCGLLGASPGNLEVLEDSLEGWTGKSITWAFLPPSLLRWLLPCCGSLLSLSAALLAWLPLGLSLSLWRHTAAGLGSGVSGGASCPVWERSCQSRAWLGSPGCAAAVRNPPHFSDTPSS